MIAMAVPLNAFVLATLTAVATVIWRIRLWKWLKNLLSSALHLHLSWRHQVKHVENGTNLPSAHYRFPNGQGDAEKFLHGKENSEIWQAKFGGIYRIWSGTAPEIVITQPEHVQEVFKDSDKHIKAINNNSGYYLGQLLGQCVGLVSQSEWKTLRAVTEQAFVRSKSITYVPLIRKRVKEHFRQLWTSSKLSQAILDPAQDLKLLPFWVVAEIIYGPLTSEMEQCLRDLAPIREQLFQYVMAGGLTRFHWSKYLFFTKANRDLRAFKTRWRQFNRLARDRARAAGGGGATSPPLLAMYHAVESGVVSEEAILQTLDEALFANLDVTLGGISWNLVFLAAYPDKQEELRREVFEQRKGASYQESAAGMECEAKEASDRGYVLSSSTYLAACVFESSRLRPLAAFSVPQAVPTPRVVGGYLFPAGTNFVIDSYALNQRNPFWGKDGLRYRPERFRSDSGAAGSGRSTRTRYNYWRFGFGPRQCMGKYVADLVIRELLIHLVENFTLSHINAGDSNEGEWMRDPETWINHPVMELKCTKRK
ncbi:cytochrome p450 monooxygenase GliC [Xylaria acuta]|nr:cytochrome p450 monooxygenase GliC [Xylaria acuta]